MAKSVRTNHAPTEKVPQEQTGKQLGTAQCSTSSYLVWTCSLFSFYLPAALTLGMAEVAQPKQRCRAAPLPLEKLLEALLLSRLIRSADTLPDVLTRSIGIVCGHEEATELQRKLKAKEIQVPQKTQLSHARLKLDLLLMEMKREVWAESKNVWVMLSSDSSPQGLDFMVTVEDRILNPGLVIDATPKELAEFSLSRNLVTSTLPPIVVGSGNSDTAAKFEGVMRSIMLDAGRESLSTYAQSVIGFCSDFGVESHLTQASHQHFGRN